MDSIAGDNSLVERQSGFGAIPGGELVDGVPVPSLGFLRRKAVVNRRSCLIEVWKAQRVLCGRFLGVTVFAAFHCWGLHAPTNETGFCRRSAALSNGKGRANPSLNRVPTAAAEVADHRQFRAKGCQDVRSEAGLCAESGG